MSRHVDEAKRDGKCPCDDEPGSRREGKRTVKARLRERHFAHGYLSTLGIKLTEQINMLSMTTDLALTRRHIPLCSCPYDNIRR